MEKGVFTAKKKDGTIYYRSSFTFKNRHISLGSFSKEVDAHAAYNEALSIINSDYSLDKCLNTYSTLSFDKIVILANFRDNNIYSPNPIYVSSKIIYYYLSIDEILKFDIDDLFYYSSHHIQKRGGHLFVADLGSQINLVNRYGIKNHAVEGKDYIFVNGDNTDYRYSNIQIINEYQGVHLLDNDQTYKYLGKKTKKQHYKTVIHINGNFIVGIYDSKEKAAIAYNKAAEILMSKGIKKTFTLNTIAKMTTKKYKLLYDSISISEEIVNYNLPN